MSLFRSPSRVALEAAVAVAALVAVCIGGLAVVGAFHPDSRGVTEVGSFGPIAALGGALCLVAAAVSYFGQRRAMSWADTHIPAEARIVVVRASQQRLPRQLAFAFLSAQTPKGLYTVSALFDDVEYLDVDRLKHVKNLREITNSPRLVAMGTLGERVRHAESIDVFEYDDGSGVIAYSVTQPVFTDVPVCFWVRVDSVGEALSIAMDANGEGSDDRPT